MLNGLYTEPVPEELSNLNMLESQFIQRAKCFQTIVRLGTYTGKVPVYNSLKAIKGNIFFLPLPLQNTLDQLDEVGFGSDRLHEITTTLPDPELYIIVDSHRTKDKIVLTKQINQLSIFNSMCNALVQLCNHLFQRETAEDPMTEEGDEDMEL